ncbi:hypothetical protein ACFWIY_20215 [Streptomyces sioyaensis]|uniref:hypothetical protein n=1 Tax=Streptomyces sioyaensis TaxID=67364 RepID=UPI00365B269B
MEMKTTAGRAVQQRIPSDETRDENGIRRRSLVWSKLEALYRSGVKAEAYDAENMRIHFDRAYYRTIATSEGSSTSLEDDWPIYGPMRRRASLEELKRNPNMVRLPRDFKFHLGKMSPDQWFRFTEGVQGPLHRWWDDPEGNVESFQDVANRLQVDYVNHSAMPQGREKTTITAIFTAIGGTTSAIALDVPWEVDAGVGAGAALVTWLISGPVAEAVDKWNRDRNVMYDLVEVLPKK